MFLVDASFYIKAYHVAYCLLVCGQFCLVVYFLEEVYHDQLLFA